MIEMCNIQYFQKMKIGCIILMQEKIYWRKKEFVIDDLCVFYFKGHLKLDVKSPYWFVP